MKDISLHEAEDEVTVDVREWETRSLKARTLVCGYRDMDFTSFGIVPGPGKRILKQEALKPGSSHSVRRDELYGLVGAWSLMHVACKRR